MMFPAEFARIPKLSSRLTITHPGCLGLIIYIPYVELG
jgi:hypothetical protein